MSRIEKGKVDIHYENFNIIETIEEVIDAEMPFAAKKGVALNLEKEEEQIVVESDPERIQQVTLNLVHNALKFTEKGSVDIECHSHNEYVEIRITDTGIGISEEDVDRIFTSFVQIDNKLAKKTTESGSGLGLTITKKLLELLNGRISVKSEFGAGSTFTVYLPLKRGQELKAAG
jgi:signal transduction histidine kinase